MVLFAQHELRKDWDVIYIRPTAPITRGGLLQKIENGAVLVSDLDAPHIITILVSEQVVSAKAIKLSRQTSCEVPCIQPPGFLLMCSVCSCMLCACMQQPR